MSMEICRKKICSGSASPTNQSSELIKESGNKRWFETKSFRIEINVGK